MKRVLTFLTIISFFVDFRTCTQTIDPLLPDPTAPKQISGMTLVWNDEFNTDGKPNTSNWKYETGFVRNQELQWYQSDNATCKNGLLVIEGRKQQIKNPNFVSGSTDWKLNRQYAEYTSASINSSGLKSFMFGHFEIRARINTSKGSWPAIWTLGNSGEWPSNGEIDILEFYLIGGVQSILANFAWGTSTRWVAKWDGADKPLSTFTSKDSQWVEKFHLWTMDWNKDTIRLSLDGTLMNETLVNQTINSDGSNPFLQAHYILLNLALGGNGGDPAGSTFPIPYEVDYVRVYQKSTSLSNGYTTKNKTQIVENRLINNKLFVKTADFSCKLSPVISIYDLNGSLIIRQKATADFSTKSYTINLNNLKAGTYTVTISGLNTKPQKIVLR
jgi:beta-glucanase (GH16 family)